MTADVRTEPDLDQPSPRRAAMLEKLAALDAEHA